MYQDFHDINQLIEQFCSHAKKTIAEQNQLSVAHAPHKVDWAQIQQKLESGHSVFDVFTQCLAPHFSTSAGTRYFGFVTGGYTPMALIGDWLTSLYDQNVMGSKESIAPQIELRAIELFKELLNLPSSFNGAFVSGATMANMVNLAIARQWIGQQYNIDVSQEGMSKLPDLTIFSGAAHSSIGKSLSMLGIGRKSLVNIPLGEHSEAISLEALEVAIKQHGKPCIVVANAGTVNTADFDDLEAIAKLKQKYNFWLHVDAAFGGFAACSETYSHLVKGIDLADSITVDGHKWLNVPYDSAIQLSKHIELQGQVFSNHASYLEQSVELTNYANLCPENSRRFRALATWFTLQAYGKKGYQYLVEKNCRLASDLATRISNSKEFVLLSEPQLNGFCFRLHGHSDVNQYLALLQSQGHCFMTPTSYQGDVAIRVSITNWRTSDLDIERTWKAMQDAYESIG